MNDDTGDLESLRRRYDRLRLLYQVGQVIHSTLDQQEALELIVREAVRLTRAASGSVVLVNPTTGFLEIQAAFGLPANATRLRLRVGEGITGWVARTGKPACVGDVTRHPRYIMVRSHVRSELAVPLEVNGEVRGVINVDADRENAFAEDDLQLLQELASQAAQVIQHTWAYEQSRLKAKLLETLVSVGQTINSVTNLDEALQVVTREACKLMGAKMCSLLLLDGSGEWLDLRASHGAGPAYIAKPRLSTVDSLLGIVVRRKRALQVENVQISSRYQSVEIARSEGLVSLLSVPLVYRGQPIGALSVYTGEPHSFSNEEIRIMTALAELSAIAIEKARLYDRVVDLEELLRHNERLSSVGLLAAEVAHEIRNPLAVMKMLYQALDLSFPEADPRQNDVRIIGEKMDQLNRIVEKILDFARDTEPTLAPVQINDILADLMLLVRRKAAQHLIETVSNLANGLPLISGDATQLSQAFLNLALNAVESMPNGGTLKVVSRAICLTRRSKVPTHVAVEFSDTGAGMSEEQRRRAFTSLLGTTKPRGTGLGLMIVARVAEAHGGKVRIVSRPGHGTTVRLILPVN